MPLIQCCSRKCAIKQATRKPKGLEQYHLFYSQIRSLGKVCKRQLSLFHKASSRTSQTGLKDPFPKWFTQLVGKIARVLAGRLVSTVSCPQILAIRAFCLPKIGLTQSWQLCLIVDVPSGKKQKLPVLLCLGPEIGSIPLVQFYCPKESQSFHLWKGQDIVAIFLMEARSQSIYEYL